MWLHREFGLIYRSRDEQTPPADFAKRISSGWKFQDPNWNKQRRDRDDEVWFEDDDSR